MFNILKKILIINVLTFIFVRLRNYNPIIFLINVEFLAVVFTSIYCFLISNLYYKMKYNYNVLYRLDNKERVNSIGEINVINIVIKLLLIMFLILLSLSVTVELQYATQLIKLAFICSLFALFNISAINLLYDYFKNDIVILITMFATVILYIIFGTSIFVNYDEFVLTNRGFFFLVIAIVLVIFD